MIFLLIICSEVSLILLTIYMFYKNYTERCFKEGIK